MPETHFKEYRRECRIVGNIGQVVRALRTLFRQDGWQYSLRKKKHCIFNDNTSNRVSTVPASNSITLNTIVPTLCVDKNLAKYEYDEFYYNINRIMFYNDPNNPYREIHRKLESSSWMGFKTMKIVLHKKVVTLRVTYYVVYA